MHASRILEEIPRRRRTIDDDDEEEEVEDEEDKALEKNDIWLLIKGGNGRI